MDAKQETGKQPKVVAYPFVRLGDRIFNLYSIQEILVQDKYIPDVWDEMNGWYIWVVKVRYGNGQEKELGQFHSRQDARKELDRIQEVLETLHFQSGPGDGDPAQSQR